eukprot:1048283_1
MGLFEIETQLFDTMDHLICLWCIVAHPIFLPSVLVSSPSDIPPDSTDEHQSIRCFICGCFWLNKCPYNFMFHCSPSIQRIHLQTLLSPEIAPLIPVMFTWDSLTVKVTL